MVLAKHYYYRPAPLRNVPITPDLYGSATVKA